MTKTELAELTLTLCKENCSQVAGPQYYVGEGPFIIALDAPEGEPKFFCFYITDTEEFLANPEAFPRAFSSEEFLFMIADNLDLEGLKHSGNYYGITFTKIVPDEPACRLAVQKLWNTDAKTASNISLLGPELILHSATSLCKNQPLLS